MATKSKKKNTKRNVPQKKVATNKKSFLKKKVKVKKERNINKKGIVISAVAVAVALIIAVVPTVANLVIRGIHSDQIMRFNSVYVDSQITPARETDGAWTFTTPRNFKIMQLSDVEFGGGCLSSMEDSLVLNAIEAMVSTEAPDLLVITGDLIKTNLFKSGTANNLAAVKLFAQMIDRLCVYWTVTLGEDDSKGLASREKIAEYLSSEELKYCLFETDNINGDGLGNNVVKIRDVNGKIIQAIYTFDTHGKNDEVIKDSQIEWYKTSLSAINEENSKNLEKGETTKSLVFMHRPLEEYKLANEAYKNKDKSAKLQYGEVNEEINCSKKSDNFFETMKELGSTQAVFCGHDHLNTSSTDYNGIRLTYCGSIDYLDYKDIDTVGKQRNCTIIEVNIDDGTFDCVSKNYYQDIYVSEFEKEQVNDIA